MKRETVERVLKRIGITLIHLYQYTFSILLGPCCRFTPSCSEYACLSIQRFGIINGFWLALRRVVKCHPLHAGGYDPVPQIRKNL